MQSTTAPETVTKDTSQMKTMRDNVYNDEEKIVELDNGLIGTSAGKILVPESLKEKILKRFHDSPYAGHLGIKRQRQGFNDAKTEFNKW
jgi:hypothetical protein